MKKCVDNGTNVCYILNVPYVTQYQKEVIPEMKREKVHAPYYLIKGYQIIKQIPDEKMADILGIGVRAYREKRDGYSDFTLQQADLIASTLGQSKGEIFLT